MKFLRSLVKYIIILLLVLIAGAILFLYLQKPKYSGTMRVRHLSAPVDVYFDDYGVPHIYGENPSDVYRVFGYIHARDRLFQMELLRRASGGRLSEIFGSRTLETDKFFRMLGFREKAMQSARNFKPGVSWNEAARAYIDGINQYIERGSMPLEFMLLNIPKEYYSISDLYLITDLMSYNFQLAFRTDPLLTKILRTGGSQYLADLGISLPADSLLIDSIPADTSAIPSTSTPTSTTTTSVSDIFNNLPFPVWSGSNGWVMSASRSKSGKVLFENDTHIQHQQPAVWYDAHLSYPGFNFYGSFLAGFPFAPLGRTPRHAWGLTILENDDLDFFEETVSNEHPDSVLSNGEWLPIHSRYETIRVRDSADCILKVRETHHGPVCSDVIKDFSGITNAPVSACWTYLNKPNNLLEVTWKMARAKSMREFRSAVAKIAAPGLNVVYGDVEDSIALWNAAHLVRRPAHVNSFVLLDGSGKDDWIGYHPFRTYIGSENPFIGYVLTANNPLDQDTGGAYPGYYAAADRLTRINELIWERKQFDVNDFREMNADVINPVAAEVCASFIKRLRGTAVLRTQIHELAFTSLQNWKGEHQLEDKGAAVYYRWLYHVYRGAFLDELGQDDFRKFMKTHLCESALQGFSENDSSVWWDNIHTPSKETSADIISNAFIVAVDELAEEFGPDPEKWLWQKMHELEIRHPIGMKKPFNLLFNTGPYPVTGGIETVNNQKFDLDSNLHLLSTHGAAIRRIVDFSQPSRSLGIIPTGQSANLMSGHYRDQTNMYISNGYKTETIDSAEIVAAGWRKLKFIPLKKR